MRFTAQLAIFLAISTSLSGEILDRVAVTVGRSAITLSALDEHLRVAAFLNAEPLRTDASARRQAAERMIEQTLVRQEMEFSRYVLPNLSEVEPMIGELAKERYSGEAGMLRALASYGLTIRILRHHLQIQLATLRFVQLRFRPAVTVGDGEIEIYYREQFVPDAEKARLSPVPRIEEASEKIERILTEQKTDRALNIWLRQAREQVRVAFIEEALQ